MLKRPHDASWIDLEPKMDETNITHGDPEPVALRDGLLRLDALVREHAQGLEQASRTADDLRGGLATCQEQEKTTRNAIAGLLRTSDRLKAQVEGILDASAQHGQESAAHGAAIAAMATRIGQLEESLAAAGKALRWNRLLALAALALGILEAVLILLPRIR
jgi:hypothetical protein